MGDRLLSRCCVIQQQRPLHLSDPPALHVERHDAHGRSCFVDVEDAKDALPGARRVRRGRMRSAPS
jgi:hypothetical protein